MENENGQGQTPHLKPEDIATQVSVVLTKSGQCAIVGDLKNLPLLLHLLGQGAIILSELVKKALTQRVIPIQRPEGKP